MPPPGPRRGRFSPRVAVAFSAHVAVVAVISVVVAGVAAIAFADSIARAAVFMDRRCPPKFKLSNLPV